MRALALLALTVLLAACVLPGCSGGTQVGGPTVTGTWTIAPTSLVLQGAAPAAAGDLDITTGTLVLGSSAGLSVTDSHGVRRTFTGPYTSGGAYFAAEDLTGTSGEASIGGAMVAGNTLTGNLEVRDTGGNTYRGSYTATK